jgi:hypothetical protein
MPSEADLMAMIWTALWMIPGIVARFWAVGLAAAITMILVMTSPKV